MQYVIQLEGRAIDCKISDGNINLNKKFLTCQSYAGKVKKKI
jgi:hypothetical protein